MQGTFEIGGESVEPGTTRTVPLPVGELPDHAPVTLPVRIVHGRTPGATLFVSAAVHGDEVLGVEIIRRLLRAPSVRKLRGTLLCVPVVNATGFIARGRYLPDRRDLNRSFPGSSGGSLASQLAHLFLREVVERCDVGIDLHTAALHRSNLPQLRISDSSARALELAGAFGAPVILISPARAGSLRLSAGARGVDVLVYEAGEALRFDEFAVRIGVKGVLQVMKHLGMIAKPRVHPSQVRPIVASSSGWVRAPTGGLFRSFRGNGDEVRKDDVLGVVSDPFGDSEVEVLAQRTGIVIGRSHLPVVHGGDALFHIASMPADRHGSAGLGRLEGELASDPVFDEDEII